MYKSLKIIIELTELNTSTESNIWVDYSATAILIIWK